LQFAPANTPPKIAKAYFLAHADRQTKKNNEGTVAKSSLVLLSKFVLG